MRVLKFLFLWLAAATAYGQSEVVEHRLSFEDRRNQYVDVQVRMPVSGDSVEVSMPNWTPGSYLIREYAAHVERLSARSETIGELGVTKVAKNRWRIDTTGATELIVEYAVWAGELGVNTNWVESGYALLNGAGTFLYSDAGRTRPQRLVVSLPPDWTGVHVALPRAPDGRAFVAKDYDELIDSPILAGNASSHVFTAEDQPYEFVNQDATGLWDNDRAVQDAARVASSVHRFWEVNPFDRPYLILNVVGEGTGGLEHDHSTVLLATAWQMRYREDYLRWLSLLAHELFHAWNVRRLRPEALTRYDYDNEMYTRELWLAEGLTSYYDNLLLFRSGSITVDEYFSLLASEIHKYELTPGRQVRSAELASFDTWIKHYKPDANSINSNISYYRKGALVGLVADMLLRRETDGESSLDHLMRELYRRHGPDGTRGDGYPPGAFQALVEEVAGAEVRKRVEALLTTVADPDVDEALDWYGLQLDRAPTRTAAEAAGRPVPAGFGVIWDPAETRLIVDSVVQGGSGAASGILPADELLAINDTRVTRDTLPDRLQRLAPGETVTLLLARHGRVFTLPVTVQHALADKYLISIRPDISRREKQRLSAWLGVKLKFVRN